MSPAPYQYRSGGRSPATIAALVIALAVILNGARDGAGLGLWSLWALVTVALSHQLLACRVRGCCIDGQCWSTFIGRRRRSIPLDQVERVVLTRGRGRAMRCTARLTDGTSVPVPTCCLPPPHTLVAKLRRHGIAVVVDQGRPAVAPEQPEPAA